MSKSFTRKDLDHVATLAALTLTDAEATRLAGEIGAILRYVDELESLDVTNVPPTAQVQLGATAWRDDEVHPGVTHDEALAQAPRSARGGFAVPAFVE